jgi:hypothetical protein
MSAMAGIESLLSRHRLRRQKRLRKKGEVRKVHPTLGIRPLRKELALAKPLKLSKKFVSQSLGLSSVEKTSSMNVKVIGGKTSSTFTGRSGAARALTHALDLFDSGSSTSDGGATNPTPPWKHPWKSPASKSVLKPSEAPVVKGIFEQFLALHLSESYDIELFLAFVTIKMVVASAAAVGVKVSGSGGVIVDEQLIGAGFAST